MPTPDEILEYALRSAEADYRNSRLSDVQLVELTQSVCRNLQNRAGVRLLLACLLAKSHKPDLDIRKPYTEIGDYDAYSGRKYDEAYISDFVTRHELPCNPTTAFLTPALRNRAVILTPDLNLVGRPPELYKYVLVLLDKVHKHEVTAVDLLIEVIRWLIVIREENRQRLESLLDNLRTSRTSIALSSEKIIRLIGQHLDQPRSSRLPVLVVAAAYHTASRHLGERVLPLEPHTAADRQTHALGDLEIALIDDFEIVTAYEMKTRKVTQNDIDQALQKISKSNKHVDNYIFVTTEEIQNDVQQYAASIYERTNGIEIVVLDCLGFLKHFLHLFHRLRLDFIENYQRFLLEEPSSGVSQPLKEVFLALRQAAESGE